jgi:hypothetical protein
MKTPAFDDLGDKKKQNPTNRRIGYLYQKGFYKIGQDQPTGNLLFSSGRKNLRLCRALLAGSHEARVKPDCRSTKSFFRAGVT